MRVWTPRLLRVSPDNWRYEPAARDGEATGIGQARVAWAPVVEANGRGKEIIYCRPIELVAMVVKVWTPFSVAIERSGPEVAKICVLDVEPFKEEIPVAAAGSQEIPPGADDDAVRT